MKEFLAIDSLNDLGTLTINGAINNFGYVDGDGNGSIISSCKSTKEKEEVIKNLKSPPEFSYGSSNGKTMNLMGAINNVGRIAGGNGNGSIIIYDGKNL